MDREGWSHSALLLSLAGPPPTAERLLSIPEYVRGSGFTMLFLDWAGTFPYAMDTRFRSSAVYSQEVVTAFVAKAATTGLEVGPIFSLPAGMGRYLSIPTYRHLRQEPGIEDAISLTAAGAHSFLHDLFGDYLELCPDTKHIYLVLRCGDSSETELHQNRLVVVEQLASILDPLRADGVEVIIDIEAIEEWSAEEVETLLSAGEVCASARFWEQFRLQRDGEDGRRSPLNSRLTRWVSVKGNDTTPEPANDVGPNAPRVVSVGSARKSVQDRTAPAWLHLSSVSGGSSGSCDAFPAEQLQVLIRQFAKFDAVIGSLWRKTRHLREMLFAVTVDVPSRRSTADFAQRQLREFRTAVSGAVDTAAELHRRWRSDIESGSLDRLLRSRTEPLQEEADQLETRFRQLGVGRLSDGG